MLKNENSNSLGCTCCASRSGLVQNGAVTGNHGEIHSGCGGRGDCLDSMPLAYVYAPDQQFRMLYSAKNALSHGTLFEELYKPMEVYGHEH